MKTLLRTAALAAALAVTALTAGKATEVPGSCHTICRNKTTGTAASANWSATYRQCCFGAPGAPNPCPPGYNVSYSESSFTYSTGSTVLCPA
jgi:hypothetical protein